VLTIRSIEGGPVCPGAGALPCGCGMVVVESPAIVCGGTECRRRLVEENGGVQAVRLRGTQASRSANRSPILGDFRALL